MARIFVSPRADAPATGPGPVLRAGFTDVLVTGTLTRRINVSHPDRQTREPLRRDRVRRAEDDEHEGHEHLGQQARSEAKVPRRVRSVAVCREAARGRLEAGLPDDSDTDERRSGRKNGRAAPAEHQPERSRELGRASLREAHASPLSSSPGRTRKLVTSSGTERGFACERR